jgi:hypothetical protein
MHLRRIADVDLMRNNAGVEIAAYTAHAADRVDDAVGIQAPDVASPFSLTSFGAL